MLGAVFTSEDFWFKVQGSRFQVKNIGIRLKLAFNPEPFNGEPEIFALVNCHQTLITIA